MQSLLKYIQLNDNLRILVLIRCGITDKGANICGSKYTLDIAMGDVLCILLQTCMLYAVDYLCSMAL